MRRALRWIPPALLSAVLLLGLRGALVYLGVVLPPFFIPTPLAQAAASHVEGIASISGGVGISTITFTQSVSAGDFLVMFVRNCGSPVVSDNVNGAWTAADPNEDNQIFYFASSSAAGANGLGVTASFSGACNLRMVVDHFAGYAGTVTVEGVSNGVVSGTAGNASTTGAVSAGDLVYAGARFGDNNITITAGTTNGQAMTIGAQQTTAANGTVGSEYALAAAVGVQNSSITVTPSVGGGPMDQAAFLFTAAQSSTQTVGAPSNLPILGVGGLGSSSPPGGGSVTTSTGSRDPALQPFATQSPCNYPLGANATYASPTFAGGGPPNFFVDNSVFGSTQTPPGVYVAKNSDPVRTFHVDNFFGTNGPVNGVYFGIQGTGATPNFSRHAPNNMTANTTDGMLVIIAPDHLVAMDGEGWNNFNQLPATGDMGAVNSGLTINLDLKGPGWNENVTTPTGAQPWPAIALNSGDEATPYPVSNPASGTRFYSPGDHTNASGLSLLCGILRSGELAHGIPHTLQLITAGVGKNKNAPGGTNQVWPATTSDGGSGSGYGTTGNDYIGSLWAIPKSVNLNALTWNHVETKNLAIALQKYGGYDMDSGGVNGTVEVRIEVAAAGEVPNDAGANADFTQIDGLLAIVTNSFAQANGTTAYGVATSLGGQPRVGFRLDQGDGVVPAGDIPSAFSATFGGGNGRNSRFRPYIPDSIWAWITKRVLH